MSLKTRQKNLKHGSVNLEVTVALPGGVQGVSVITKKLVQDLRLTNTQNESIVNGKMSLGKLSFGDYHLKGCMEERF
jgi:molybdopterin-binding protein